MSAVEIVRIEKPYCVKYTYSCLLIIKHKCVIIFTMKLYDFN